MITPFALSDFANPFRTYTAARPGVLSQTSHKWNGSDNVPKAGATPPVGNYPTGIGAAGNLLNKPGLSGSLSCSRCHDLHNEYGNTFVTRQNHFLRADNTNDALCLNCHTVRNTTTSLTGSHPVNVTYATAVANKPTKFKSSPVSSNPANASAASKLINGKVYCSTCHSVHFADSNSSTFDNRSSARFGRFSASDGNLLRSSLRTANATAVNLCTNCHDGKLNHNGANQNVQCGDCHGGHVDEADGTVANKYVVNRFMRFSSAYGAVRNKTAFFQYTGATTRNYVDANGTGVCQACHAVPAAGTVSARTGVTYPDQHNSMNAKVCNDCHFHTSTSGSFSGGCTSCHGYPPQSSTVGGSTGKASASYALDEATTKHKKHMDTGSLGCVDCHYDVTSALYSSRHKNSDFQNVFVQPGGRGAQFGANPTYSKSGKTCSNVYCHSNGAPAGGSLVTVTTPNWVGGSVTCDSCHQASPTTNVHQNHLSKGLACQNCHNATTKDGISIFDAKKHADGNKDISLSHATLPINGATNCTNVYCHSNGKGVYKAVAWTNTPTGQCTACHETELLNTGAHNVHLRMDVNYGPRLISKYGVPTITPLQATACNKCHDYPNGHMSGSVQSPTNCTIACHPNGLGVSASTGLAVTWTSGTRIDDCTKCHNANPSYVTKYAPYKEYFSTTGHGQTTPATICTSCHDSTTAHFEGGDRLAIDANDVMVCNTCHEDAGKVANEKFRGIKPHFATKGGTADLVCVKCHDPHGTGNLSMVKSSIAFINSTSWVIDYTDRDSKWVNTTTNRGLCQVCHTQTAHYRAGVAETKHPTTNCYNCHNHKDERGAFKPKGTCDSCHGYPPVPANLGLNQATDFAIFNSWSSAQFENYSGGGGAHLIPGHIPASAKASEGWANCAVCHNGGDTSSTSYHIMETPVSSHLDKVTVNVDNRYKFNASKYITYSGAQFVNPPSRNATGKCFNVSCHLAPSPRWSTER